MFFLRHLCFYVFFQKSMFFSMDGLLVKKRYFFSNWVDLPRKISELDGKSSDNSNFYLFLHAIPEKPCLCFSFFLAVIYVFPKMLSGNTVHNNVQPMTINPA